MASALEANSAGHLTSVDSTRWRWRNPTPQEVIERSGLGQWVTLDKRFSTYTWFLKTEFEKCLGGTGAVRPKYDFIFLDGAKNWSTDGLTVVLAEKLLRPGGWLLLDDLGWSYEEHVNAEFHYEIEVAKLSEAERVEPHLQAVFELLIVTNPAFDEFRVEDNWWGWARKSPDATPTPGRRSTAVQALTRTRGTDRSSSRYIRGVRRRLGRLRRAPTRLLGR